LFNLFKLKFIIDCLKNKQQLKDIKFSPISKLGKRMNYDP